MGSDLCRGVSPPAHFKPSPLGEGGWPSGQTDEGIVQGQVSLEKLCRAREGELPRRGKRSWPGPRPRRAVFGVSFAQGSFAACGRRVTLPMAARRRKVRLSPFPPGGENCDRFLAPPLPGEPASLGFAGSTGELTKTPPGTAPEEHRSGAPSRLSPDPITGVTPWGRQRISGAQNWSGGQRFLPGHWALGLQKLPLVRFHSCA